MMNPSGGAQGRTIVSVLFALSLSMSAGAQDVPAIARYVPATPDLRHVFVMDSAHILSSATIAALQDSARALQTETGADIAWVTLPDIGGRPIEQAALHLFRTWKIGSAGNPGDPLRHRGLLILYVPDKTKTAGPNFRIEVGRGLEGTITDSRSRSITTAMREDLRAKRYDAAYLKGWPVAAALVREDFAAAAKPRAAVPNPTRTVAREHAWGSVVGITFVVLIGLLILVIVVASRKRRAGPPVIVLGGDDDYPRRSRFSDDDDDSRRRSSWASSDSSSSDSSSGSDGGSFGGGGGDAGGGSSDTI